MKFSIAVEKEFGVLTLTREKHVDLLQCAAFTG